MHATIVTADDTVWHENPIVVVIPSFNNKAWYKRNLESVWQQKYSNFRVIYIDDCSPDGTGKLVAEYVTAHPHHFDFKLIQNGQRCGPLANYYNAIHSCKDYEIVVCLDGDDFFAHEQALGRINYAYECDPMLLFTYGQFINYINPKRGSSWARAYPADVKANNSYRKAEWVVTHPRSFYAGLFKKIKQEDLMRDGAYIEACIDFVTAIPMLEMAGGRYEFIPHVLYIYNNSNPISEHRLRLKTMKSNVRFVRGKEPYSPLSDDQVRVIRRLPEGHDVDQAITD